jgi:uncharacterized membrane protein
LALELDFMLHQLFFSKIILVALVCISGLIFFGTASAQSVFNEVQETVKAQVLEILSESEREIIGTGATTTVQKVRIEFLEGAKVGMVTTFDNDIVTLRPKDTIFVSRLEYMDGYEEVVFRDVERRSQLLFIALIMVVLVILFAGWQGVRSLLSLVLSMLAILFILVPALLAGYSPAWVSLGVSAAILSIILFLTHGVRPHVVIAFLGTLSAVAVTCLMAAWSVGSLRLTGFTDDATVFLNFATGGGLDFAGLLLGGMIIGLLGVLDDVAITQASVVHELRRANSSLSMIELYKRAIAVGRDHIGSLVNTLALAYVGASLPLVLLFARANSDWWLAINQEIIAAELLRIIVGSIGLILAVPFTTYIAAWYFKDKILEEKVEVTCSHGHQHH